MTLNQVCLLVKQLQSYVKCLIVHLHLVACGNNHTLAVAEDGKLYACGSNDFGQLGHSGPRTKLRK
jgi:alpha-tubulin suppressor-like RCC1 family protein